MMVQRILVIEDEADLVRALEFNLKQSGFEVMSATRGRDGLKTAQVRAPDLVILDVMLPDMSGIDICRKLKNDTKTAGIPVVMLTAKSEEVDRVVGFEMGADDYVTKPFSVRELILRVKAILRRGGDVTEAQGLVEFGCLRVDMAAHRVYVNGEEAQLTAIEFRLLVTLLNRKNRVQTRETLLNDVWGIHLNVETRTVDTHIKRLREKVGDAGGYIHTVRGVGYRFANSPDEVE